jgi:hypothetical protein
MALHHLKTGSEIEWLDHSDQAFNYRTIWMKELKLSGYQMFPEFVCPVRIPTEYWISYVEFFCASLSK